MDVKYTPTTEFHEGDVIHIDSVRDIANNLKDFIGFCTKCYQASVDFVTKDGAIDTRTPTGKLMMHMFMALDKFDDRYFLGKEE